MRLITIVLAILLILIQYPLWFGKGGWRRVWELDQQVTAAQKKNDDLKLRNAKLESDVRDLKEGTDSIEESARYEMGMIKQGETFVQIADPDRKAVLQPVKK
jgi:cell division protein FtsB